MCVYMFVRTRVVNLDVSIVVASRSPSNRLSGGGRRYDTAHGGNGEAGGIKTISPAAFEVFILRYLPIDQA